jgi:hypothetical protein
MIGRMSGKYPPPGNPLLYRIKNSNTNKGHIVHQYENDKSAIHFNQLDSMHNFRYNIPSAHNQFERYADICHNLLQGFDRDRESRKKQETEELINQVGGMYSDFLPPEKVQAIVTEFRSRLDSATDYIAIHALYTELDNHRTRLFNRALSEPTWSNTH